VNRKVKMSVLLTSFKQLISEDGVVIAHCSPYTNNASSNLLVVTVLFICIFELLLYIVQVGMNFLQATSLAQV
jgi:hypothetical protein